MFSNILLASALVLVTSATPVPQWNGWPSGGHGGHGPPHGPPGGPPAGPNDEYLRSLPITRDGGELQLAGKKWAGAGANVYWLGLVKDKPVNSTEHSPR